MSDPITRANDYQRLIDVCMEHGLKLEISSGKDEKRIATISGSLLAIAKLMKPDIQINPQWTN